MKILVIMDFTACDWINISPKFKVTAFLLLQQADQDTIMQDVTNIFKSSCQLKTLGARPSTAAVVGIVCVSNKSQDIHTH